MAATQGDFPDGRMQKMMGKPWSSWNLPEQPTDLDLRKLRDAFQPPEQFKTTNESTPLAPNYVSLFGTHPDSDFLSINKCAACGWLLKIQHANKHYLRDSRGAIVCRESDLAIFENRVIGKACHPVGELSETYSRKILMRLLQPPPHTLSKSSHSLRGAPSITELVSKSRSGSHSKTDYLSHSSSSYRSRSHSSQVHTPSSSYNMPKSRSSTSSGSHGSLSVNSSSSLSKSKSVKSSHSSSTSTWSSLRSSNSSKSSHKSTSGSYTLSIPSEDMGQNESVEDLLMSNMTHSYSSSKHTVHIIATSNSSKSKPTDSHDYDHIKFYSDVPEKRLKLDSHSHHKSSLSHTSSSDGHDSYSRSKSKHSSSSIMNGTSSHGLHSDSKKSKSSSSSHSKNDSGSSSSSSNKHHLRSTSSTLVTVSKPYSSTAPSLSSSSGSSSSRSHHFSGSMSSISDKEKDKDRSSSSKKKKRKRDKDEPRKIIPLKDRDFNPDKHCGVCTPGSNLPCKRSLTCKTHSVASRRAVSGRSQSFDALLAAHKLAKTEEKKLTVKEEEPLPQKAKKKKPSGGSSSLGLSPNDQPTALAHEHTSYVRTRSPDIEVISVKTATASKPKPAPQPKPEKPPEKPFLMPELAPYPPKKFKTCPLVYPYTPDLQAKFEGVWNNPSTLQRHQQMTYEEKNKFLFLLKHYKNPFFLNVDTVAKPVPKNTREKRNVFSNWNPAQTPVSGSQRPLNSWSTAGDSKRQMNDSDDPIMLAHITRK